MDNNQDPTTTKNQPQSQQTLSQYILFFQKINTTKEYFQEHNKLLSMRNSATGRNLLPDEFRRLVSEANTLPMRCLPLNETE